MREGSSFGGVCRASESLLGLGPRGFWAPKGRLEEAFGKLMDAEEAPRVSGIEKVVELCHLSAAGANTDVRVHNEDGVVWLDYLSL